MTPGSVAMTFAASTFLFQLQSFSHVSMATDW